ncbi:hypothetical protein BUALT_Bualt12G0101300 [Buddleja alternifolia]|uniref:GRF-type domain-containing protein n=1 Tax=Buddleja alternifolia TaxID=168488 RepID=A0AAV6WY35_9LAMI|nr:hypothetical protein BUALT_Bualt12G0101300 [Buddleja alternifolia]
MASSSSTYRRYPKQPKQNLDLRYASTPQCSCKVKAHIRVVESEWKASKGQLYYCCPTQTCNFFRWCKPQRATWSPIGTPVVFSPVCGGDSFGGNQNFGSADDGEEVEEIISSVSRASRVGVFNREDVNGCYLHMSWMICAILCTMLVFILFLK